MKTPKELFKLPEKITNTTQTAVILSTLALVVACIALFAASRKGDH